MSRASNRRKQKLQDAKLSAQHYPDESLSPLSEAELKKRYKKPFGFQAGDSNPDALISFVLEMQRLRHLASL